MKKTFLSIVSFCIFNVIQAQIIFQEKCNGLTLSTYTTLYSTTQYTTVPSGFIEMSEGYSNTKGSALHPNAPFHTDSLKNKGWGVVYNDILKDTFFVSTSWVDSNRAISRWLILPPVSGISVNSVLYWKAMAPDANNADGYAVYISTNTSVNDTSVFSNSNKVFQLYDNSTSGGGEKQQWTHRSISLANYSGQSIRIGFKNISRQKYQLWVDDITVENLPYANDASIENVGNIKYVGVNQSFALKARIKNEGYQNISNIQLAYSIQGISYNSQSFSLSSNLIPLTTTTVAFTNTLSINTAGMYRVKIWVNQVNGQIDQNTFNDTISYYLSVINNPTMSKVLIEQITDVSMPDAPACQDTLEILKQDTNIIVVQIHQQDSMMCNVSSLHTKNYMLPENLPLAMINRQYSYSDNKNYFFRNELKKQASVVISEVSPCNISISNVNADTLARNIQLDVNISFLQNTVGDYRVGVYVLENNVYGNPADTTINGYNQLSSFYFTPYSNYYQKGYYSSVADAFVMNAYQYHHQFVLHQSLNGIYGDASIIPNNTNAFVTYTKTYTVSIPTATNGAFKYHFDNLYIMAYLYEHDTLIENRKILNAAIKKVTSASELVSVEHFDFSDDVIVYPNPASNVVLIYSANPVSGKIVNLMGQCVGVLKGNFADVSMLSEGVYYLVIESGEQVLVKKLLIQR